MIDYVKQGESENADFSKHRSRSSNNHSSFFHCCFGVFYRGIELLQKLIKARNSIVHLKSTNIQWSLWESAMQKIQENNQLILDSAITCFECIGLLGKALSERDPDDEPTKLLAAFTATPKYRIVAK
jgi:hypothetical protein